MPEIKNTFLKSKMNKDLDSRIVPNGEYRDAKNVSVSRSEGSDVGSLENVLGNSQLTDLKTKIIDQEKQKIEATYNGVTIRPNEINLSELEIIGYCSEVSRDLIFLFLTDYRDSSGDLTSNFAPADSAETSVIPNTFYYKGAACYIVQYNILTNESTILVAGNFLNFSKTHPIYSVNILENLLFWTDNRNQPRKINIEKALNTPWENSGANNPYYYNEDHISVAKYSPVYPFEFIDSSNNSTLISNNEEFLPIHISTACNTQTSAITDTQITIVGVYTSGTSGNVDIITDSSFPYQGDVLVIPAQEQSVSSGDLTEDLTYEITGASTGVGTTTINLATQLFRIIDAGTKLYIKRRSLSYNENYKGDQNLLKDEFSKFSYRFKYDDDEYSLMAPFTQSAFVPRQFGYFIDEDESVVAETASVQFFENQIDQVKLNLTLPFNASDLQEKLKIKEVQILVKNSDEQAVRVIEDVDILDIVSGSTGSKYEYDYLSTKAIKTLPEANLIRVHDKTPIKALAQEVIANRVVYGNFQTKHGSPNNLKYDLNYINKPATGTLTTDAITIEHPNHTLKQNRSYQIGIVLVDRYGRASNVILNDPRNITNKNSTIYAPYINASNLANLNYFGSMIELNLRSKIPTSNTVLNYPGLYSETNPLGYYSYRIVIKQQEQDYYNVYVPGTLAGKLLWNVNVEASSAAPDRDDQLPSYITKNKVSMINLFGDNINKVPRELKTSSNANDSTFGSETTLFNRVNPIYDSSVVTYNFRGYNKQSKINRTGQKVVSIEPFKNLGAWTTTKGVLFPAGNENISSSDPQPWYPYYPVGTQYNFHDIFFNAQSNPFIATIETEFKIGATPNYKESSPNQRLGIERAWQDLGVYETKPTKSLLDIYYESSTSGLITDLNNEISSSIPVGVKDSNGNSTVLGNNIEYLHLESDNASSSNPVDVTLEFQLVDSANGIINVNSTLITLQVTDGLNNIRHNEFRVVNGTILPNSFKIQAIKPQVFLSKSTQNDNFTFNLLATDIQNTTPLYSNVPIKISNCQLQNVAPIWVNPPSPSVYKVSLPDGSGMSPFVYVNGVIAQDLKILTVNEGDLLNGSFDVNRNTEEIILQLVDQDLPPGVNQPGNGANDFELLYDSSLNSYDLILKSTITNGNYFLAIKAIDADGNGLSTNTNIKIESFNL
tara:strand:- start:688 stop:4212 length:3525 start_codon:yes stop_codon:yes gene_type:complete